MNRIVKNPYPASKLPDDLRQGIDPAANVVVTVEEVAPSRRRRSIDEIWAMRKPPFRSQAEIDSFIKEQRDEPDDV